MTALLSKTARYKFAGHPMSCELLRLEPRLRMSMATILRQSGSTCGIHSYAGCFHHQAAGSINCAPKVPVTTHFSTGLRARRISWTHSMGRPAFKNHAVYRYFITWAKHASVTNLYVFQGNFASVRLGLIQSRRVLAAISSSARMALPVPFARTKFHQTGQAEPASR